VEGMSTLILDHLGLVAASIKNLGLIEKLDVRLPLSKDKMKTSMGERVAAMILNGLGFIDDRLYLFPKFLENKPVDRLFGRDIRAEHFNDDALGRCLDEISAYGETRLFSEIAFEIGIEQNLLGRSAHFDTSSLSLQGSYDESDSF
jgi:transposase